jgi:hypothetical protein
MLAGPGAEASITLTPGGIVGLLVHHRERRTGPETRASFRKCSPWATWLPWSPRQAMVFDPPYSRAGRSGRSTPRRSSPASGRALPAGASGRS